MTVGVDRLCFGTSTFVAGRLRPDKDSAPGMATLAAAIHAGVTLIHTNPNLDTQWAVRRVLDSADHPHDIQHLIKTEAPLDLHAASMRARIEQAITTSRDRLGIDRLHAVVLEIDLKRTRDRARFVDEHAVDDFYSATARTARASGAVDSVIAYCHSPAHMAVALAGGAVDGVAAQYNLTEPWPALFLDQIDDHKMTFVGMSPLRRGSLAKAVVSRTTSSRRSLAAVRWAAADPRVETLVITLSSVLHLHQTIKALHTPLPASSVNEVAARWLGRRVRTLTQRKATLTQR